MFPLTYYRFLATYVAAISWEARYARRGFPVSEEGPRLASKTPGKLRSEACEEGKMRKRRPWVFVLGILMLLSGSTFGQVATTGKIAGMVTDSSGAAVPNATVTVKSTSLMAERTTGTGADGAYLFDLLPLGTYEVTAAAKGFKGNRSNRYAPSAPVPVVRSAISEVLLT